MIARIRFPIAALAALFSALPALPAFAHAVTFTDLTDRKVELAEPAKRIVAFPVAMASVVIALDQSIERIVALHPEAKLAIEDGILGSFYPEAKNLPGNILAGGGTRGRNPNIEELKRLNTDLVIQWAHASAEIVESMKAAGLNTAFLRWGTEPDVRDAIRLLATAIGKPDRADLFIKLRDETAAAIDKGVADLPPEQRPKVAYFFYALTELHTEGSGSYADWQIHLAGGRNSATDIDGWKQVSAEEVARWNPDVILIGSFEPGLHVNRIHGDAILSGTNAAKNKRVYKVPIGGYRWGPGSAESPLYWMWLADLLHPDRFKFDVRAEIAEWYPRLYGKTPTKDQIDAILEMEINGASANYEQFVAK